MMNSGMTPADLAAVAGNKGAFGDDGAFMWIILLFAMMFGWGGNGLYGNGVQGVADNYTLASDFSTLSRQVDSQTSELMRQTNQIGNGICDGFYTNAQLVNGTNMNILNAQNALQAQIAESSCQARYDNLQNANALQNAVNNGFCQTNYNNSNNTRDLLEAQNASTQAILAKLNMMESNAKDERIAALTADVQALRLGASQQAQNQYLINALRPSPIPAYAVQNPYCSCSYNGGTTLG